MSFFAPIQSFWQQLKPREKGMVTLAIVVVCCALFWWLTLAPTLKVASSFEQKNHALDVELEQMQQFRQQALQYQDAANSLSPNQAVRLIESDSKRLLGASTQVNVLGSRATVRFTSVPASSVFAWLEQVRQSIKSTVVQLELNNANQSAKNDATWSGTVQLNLPQEGQQ